jgi:hypothetical protein
MSATAALECTTETRVTRSLLGYGVIAGPVYVTVSLAQALTRPGFDLSRHSWSLLSNGDLGWIQITNFLLTGAMVIAFGIGLRRATGSRWAGGLVTAFGVSMLGAAVFRADPAFGFPVGAPADQGTVSWHGMLHLLCGGIGFLCVVAAGLLLARRHAAAGRRGLAAYTAVSSVGFLGSFFGIAAGAPVLIFVAGILALFTWMSVTAVSLYRQ